jgi:hypothetical protein
MRIVAAFYYRGVKCEIVEQLGYFEGRIYANVSQQDFVGHHGCDFRTVEYCGFRTNHLSDCGSRLLKAFPPGVDYIACELKKTVDKHVQLNPH